MKVPLGVWVGAAQFIAFLAVAVAVLAIEARTSRRVAHGPATD